MLGILCLCSPVLTTSPLQVILSALWNLSAHCKKNKSDVCSLEGSLVFLVQLLRSKSTAVVENGGGILRNISSFIATCPQGEQYRLEQSNHNDFCLALALVRGERCSHGLDRVLYPTRHIDSQSVIDVSK